MPDERTLSDKVNRHASDRMTLTQPRRQSRIQTPSVCPDRAYRAETGLQSAISFPVDQDSPVPPLPNGGAFPLVIRHAIFIEFFRSFP